MNQLKAETLSISIGCPGCFNKPTKYENHYFEAIVFGINKIKLKTIE